MSEKAKRVVVVTGASAGVGRAAARLFAKQGDDVALLARGEKGLAAAEEEVRKHGVKALRIQVDVADYDQVAAAARRVEAELGPVDVWVNNAFATVFAPFTAIEPEEFRRVTDVTYHGYVYGTKVALELMIPRERGTIVQVGSTLAYRGIPLQSAYCGAKHAIQGFTESLRCELKHDRVGVHVTMVQMPALNTPQFDWALSRMSRRAQPVPPIYQPEVAARAVVYAAGHPKRREYWVGASTVGTLLANKLAPGLLDRYLAATGYRSQQTDRPEQGGRPVNLWEPVDSAGGEDYGARGRFGPRQHRRSIQMWLSHHHKTLGAAVVAAAAGAYGLTRGMAKRAG